MAATRPSTKNALSNFAFCFTSLLSRGGPICCQTDETRPLQNAKLVENGGKPTGGREEGIHVVFFYCLFSLLTVSFKMEGGSGEGRRENTTSPTL